MKIGIDIRTACEPSSGKSRYTWHLVRELVALDRVNEYILYTDRVTASLGGLMARAQCPTSLKIMPQPPLLWHFAVIKDFVKQGGQLFFSPTSFIIPAFLPPGVASIITVHDLVAFLHPRFHQTKATVLEHLFLGRALKKAQQILTPSQHTKEDLMRLFRLHEKKIAVTQLGATQEFFETPSEARKEALRKKFNLPDEFILTVAGLEPRKNVGLLLDVFQRIHKKHPKLDLVIVGGKGWKSKKVLKALKKAGHTASMADGQVRVIERCDAAELPIFYDCAKIFVYPSLYEGFGLPPLEALAAGCPVICSNASSLPEVVGESALMFDPKNGEQLEAHLEKLLADKNLREHLSRAGRRQAEKFTWRRTAEQTLKVFNKTM